VLISAFACTVPGTRAGVPVAHGDTGSLSTTQSESLARALAEWPQPGCRGLGLYRRGSVATSKLEGSESVVVASGSRPARARRA
jgi:hypothetical protein